MIEGYLKKNDNGRYEVRKHIELTCGAQVEVKTSCGWLLMRLEHDGMDYYFIGHGFSFYPRKVYVRHP